ncbi:hypothetical protein [Brevibacillus borstelensis]|uniref:hypothetical protein n=1 Tax=Brevibacillus borstelensis TaxID=45462 RepID=UPI0006847BA9|nr:hypothetical protein [Brevibacillus borstelensis]MCC0567095.1 hypothetical protein [Brevibacillus borstelensis]MCM3473507.1 hypothetical protein [Brevibacillus borstelensis]MCM3561455.1 hypothetical protein [Brevibacillus borstelensis]MCM3594001.1 hypothetical protein [Brevibacillus borstelensis]
MSLKYIDEFDDGFPDGIFSIPRNPNQPRVKVRALYQYCIEKGVTPQELSEAEMERFLVRKAIKC